MKNKIVIYRFTGKQGIFYIPKKWCKECDLLVNLVHSVIDEYNIEDETELVIRPWFLWFIVPVLQYRSIHAPMLIINNKLISAGDVPSREDIKRALSVIDETQ